MSERTPEELMEAVLARELGAQDPAVQELARRDAAFAAQLARLTELAAGIEEAGRHERRILAAARDVDAPALDEALEEVLRRELGPGSPAPAPEPRGRPGARAPRRYAWALLTAAAALVVLGVALRGFLETDTAPGRNGKPRYLGEDTSLHPRGEVASFASFTWDLERDPAGWFEVEVFDAEGRRVASSGELEGNRWTPTDEQRARFGRSIRWTVRVFANQNEIASESAEAWLDEEGR